LPDMDVMNCQDLAVPLVVMQHVVNVESSYNPYAIGVVGGRLVRQPGSLSEALATVRMLESRGYNFSLGLAQVNRYNLGRYGLKSYEKAFQACPNLRAGARILAECHAQAGNDWGKAFSCYYSGNFVTGYRLGYVQKVFASMRSADAQVTGATFPRAIEGVEKVVRRTVAVTRYPVSMTPMRRIAEKPIRIALQASPADVATPAPEIPMSGAPSAAQATVVGTSMSVRQAPQALIAGPGDQAQKRHADDAFVF
jgi:type IV secretion system protein VirB1